MQLWGRCSRALLTTLFVCDTTPGSTELARRQRRFEDHEIVTHRDFKKGITEELSDKLQFVAQAYSTKAKTNANRISHLVRVRMT
jgi:hypothetical protein